jgi:hypothetical protein
MINYPILEGVEKRDQTEEQGIVHFLEKLELPMINVEIQLVAIHRVLLGRK